MRPETEHPLDIRVSDIDNAVLRDLFDGCRPCVYWERPERLREASVEEATSLKSEWFERTAARFGPCGKLLYVDDEPAAYCQYAPARRFPGVSRYGGLARRLDKDDVLITCLCVSEKRQRKGLGRKLLEAVVEDLKTRNVKAVVTFARDDSANNCSGPTVFYPAQGFSVVATETYPGDGSYFLVSLGCGGRQVNHEQDRL